MGPCVPLLAYGFGRRYSASNPRAVAQAFLQLRNRRSLGNVANLCQKEVRNIHSGQSCLGLQRAMQAVRNIANLDHSRHVLSMDAGG